ncbi:hypothetical protein H7F51_10350 [Novosphingobium flavum]|uniref:Uncharacterized protein n=1 Tax=Novosphingobium flavum TaxID=1778672 RepID=A0A7X1FS23_9SPHN|nr:hypothetical protein [Novosphingobium flavum]MBC2665926.1 hypothetical protein [Novosphingobium flavum]
MINNLFRKALLLVPAAALALPAVAQADEAKTFVRDGVKYTYTKTEEKGATVLSGTADNRAFRLVVKDGVVTGNFGYQPVTFTTAEAKGSSLAMR